MSSTSKVFHIFYSKDVRKKKKVYSEGILLCEDRKTKIFTSEGECVVSLNSRSCPVADEQYTINNAYVVLIDKEASLQSFLSGKIFIQNQVVSLNLVKKAPKVKESLHKIELDIAKQFENGLKIESFIYPNLRLHQVQGIKFMYDCITGRKGSNISGCILADFMGLGKTLQTLTLIRCLLVSKIVAKVIVICPLTLIKVWEKQSLKWMGSKLNPLIALGTPEEIGKVFRMFVDYQYRFLVASYEQFYKFSQSLGSKCDLMIFDEGHRLKNKKSKLFRKIQGSKCKKRILLTGTPIQNNLDELYTCISLVNPSFFESESVFKNVFQKPIIFGMAKTASRELRTLALSRTAELADLIKEFSLRRKADVLQSYLPKKREYQIFLKLSPLQLSLYERILKKKINDTEVLSYLNQMRKLFTHPILFKADRFQNFQWKECYQDCRDQKSCKMQFVQKLALHCKEADEKVVIVSYFTETLDFIEIMLNQLGVTSAKLDGRLQAKQRYYAVQNFIKTKTVLLLSGKAGGTGLTLTCACKMIMMEPDWNPSNDSQVMGRIWRQGQQKQVEIYRLMIGSSFQEKILQRQQLKQSLSQKLIDEEKNSKIYDFFSMKQLFMEITSKCVTYSPNDNSLDMCQEKMPYADWSNCVFVKMLESHKENQNKLANQFEQAQFQQIQTEEEEQEKETSEQNIQEQDFSQLRYLNEEVSITEKKINFVDILKLQNQVKAAQILQVSDNQSSNKQSCSEESKQETKIQEAKETIKDKADFVQPDSQIWQQNQQIVPLAFKKFKKRLLKIDCQ